MNRNTYTVMTPEFFREVALKTEKVLRNRLQRAAVAFSILCTAAIAVQII